jgi:hypothetical protein
MTWSMSIRTVLLASALMLLAGCGGGGSSGTASSSTASATSVKSTPQLSLGGSAPSTATTGQLYTFTPQVSGVSGSVAFTIQNTPSWATFNASTGTLSGTPQAANVGTYSNIVISASDSQGSSSLPAFTITVAQANSGAGNVTLSWTAPTVNTDGTPLTDLAGYKIYYGTSASSMSNVITVSNGVTSYVIEGLTAGTWYFAVQSYTSTGAQSALSNVVSKTIT